MGPIEIKKRPSFLHLSVDEPLALSSYKIKKKTSTLTLENRITIFFKIFCSVIKTFLLFLFCHQILVFDLQQRAEEAQEGCTGWLRDTFYRW